MRVNELDLACVQKQATAIELLPEKIIMLSVAVSRIANNGVKYMLHVSPDLVLAAGERRSFDERISCCGVAAYRIG